MSAWISLAAAILAEVIATSALKASAGFTRALPSTLVVVGYGAAFYLLSITLRSIPVGIAYAIWSGTGTVLVALIAWWIYGQHLDTAAWIGIALIIAGVLVMNLLSHSTPH